MSDPLTKAERSKAKDKRQTPAQDGICSGHRKRKKQPKDWWAICQDPVWWHGQAIHKAATKEQVEAWCDKWNRTLSSHSAKYVFKIVYMGKKKPNKDKK